MPLKVVVELQIHAVTCPGVFLPEKGDLFLNVSLMGLCKETGCLPAIFPLLFHEKMRFEKVFRQAIDPAEVAQHLENHTATFELIQLTHSAEEVLAIYDENNREFLFPEPKLAPPYPGVDREVLMKTAPGFPGIAPKVEFSSRTTIKEIPCDVKKKCRFSQAERSLSKSPRKSSGHKKKSGCAKKAGKRYDSPTQSSRCRSPSPYTRRRICELGKDNQQRLAHLNLGNFEFKSGAEARPPFVVRHVDHSKPVGEKSSLQIKSPKTKHRSRSIDILNEPPLRRALSFDSICNEEDEEKSFVDSDKRRSTRKNISFEDPDNAKSSPYQFHTLSLKDGSTSPVQTRTSLHERFKSGQSTWELIHNRVRSLLSTHSAKEKLYYDISKAEVDHILERSFFSNTSANNSFLKKTF
ncbi:spermatogenesis associated 6-like protein [Spea bombifrons]|uniref:spermatogenesis associated 6-like protein n=1 Tax=Spea bombifrons TaxID=233779 RepID=UPI00234A3FD5|nr:spermatogenesis associated 6-like protein [Spea bombifrons]